MGNGQRTALVNLTGVGYLGLTLLLAWQALRGQSVVAPDGLTWAAYAALIGLVGGGMALVGWSAFRVPGRAAGSYQ